MIDVEARIRSAATNETLRAAASAIWKRVAPTIFSQNHERNGLRVSDAGNCVRQVFAKVNGTPESFESQVYLFNLDEGTMTGCWWACLLAASLEADFYRTALELEVSYEGTPGHVDLYYELWTATEHIDRGIVEFKKTGSWKAAPQRWHVLQLCTYLAAKGVEDGAVVSIAPAAKVDKVAVTWYKLSEQREAIEAEWARLSAALGPVEPVEDVNTNERFRCKGCIVKACTLNDDYVPDILPQLENSLR